MKALCWHGKGDVRYDEVPDPKIEQPGDVILRITRTAICGSDLHLYDGYIPAMKSGDILGHEFMGEVVETGPDVQRVRKGDRVVVPFNISCGHCYYCEHDLYSLCDNTNRDADKTAKAYGHAPAGLFGYSHLFGGYAGGQAEYVRVPHADVGPLKVPRSLDDDTLLFLTDIFPTGYQSVADANIKDTDTVAIWGCGPVGLFAMKSARLLGARNVIAIDRVPERLALTRDACGATVIDESNEKVFDRLMDLTGGHGPDVCVDSVGLEAHGTDTLGNVYDKVKTAIFQETDHANVLRQMILCARKGGTISIPGVYGGVIDKFPIGPAFGKSLNFRMGQTHTHKWMRELLGYIENGDIDPTFLITHRLPLSEGPDAYRTFREKQDGCIKVVMTP